MALLLFSISRQKHQQLFKNQVTNFIEIARTLKQAAVMEFVGQEKKLQTSSEPCLTRYSSLKSNLVYSAFLPVADYTKCFYKNK
jgi:hypothetical protein